MTFLPILCIISVGVNFNLIYMFRKFIKFSLFIFVLLAFFWMQPTQAAGWVAQNSKVVGHLFDIQMWNHNVGFAVGEQKILKTIKGGSGFSDGWSIVYNTAGETYNGIAMASESVAWVVGNGGKILKTIDGGANWQLQSSGVTANLNDVAFWSSTGGLAVGAGGTILRTLDGGTTWTQLSAGISTDLYEVATLFNPFTAKTEIRISSANGRVLYGYFYGSDTPTWTVQNTGTVSNLLSIDPYFSSAGTGLWVAGANGVILTSSNGGTSWTSKNNPALSNTLYAIVEADDGTIYVAGASGAIYKGVNNNGNYTWSAESTGITATLYGLTVIPSPLTLWAVGLNGKIIRYDETAPSAVSNIIKTTVNTDNTPTFTWLAGTDDVNGTYGTGISFYEYSVDGASYSNNGNNLTLTLSQALTDGTHTLAVRAVDAAANTGAITTLNFTIDTIAPVVGVTTPNIATVGVAQKFIASFSDNIGVAGCYLIVNDVLQGSVNLAGALSGTAEIFHTFFSTGSYNISFSCNDSASNVGYGLPVTAVTVSGPPDTIVPTVGAVSPATATVGMAQIFSATYADSVGVASCNFYLDGANLGAMVLGNAQSGTAQKTLTFSAAGSHQAYASCKDAAQNTGTSSSVTTIVVSAAAVSDTAAPTVSSITPTTAQATVAQPFTASYSDSVGVVSCDLYVDSAGQGPMSLSGTTAGTASRVYTFINTASHILQARCSDAAGNVGLGALTTVSVSAAPAAATDITAPSTPPGLQKISNDADATPTFVWNTANDNVGATNYLVQIDNGSLIDNGGSTSYTIPGNLNNGSHTFKVLAKDAAGNTSPSSSFSFTVNAGPAAVSCPLFMEKAYKSSASKAVYYITTDCTKRPFKNGPSFFTYFDSWSEVITTTKTILDSVANDLLGFTPAGPKYDPKYGALVKIVTDPKVYLLLGTEKYWIISESVFTGLKYDWKWVEDVDPGLLNKYSVGSEITYTDHHPNYTIIKYAGFANTYRLEPDPDDYSKQVKRWIKNEKVFNALKFRWDRIVTVPNSEVYKDGKVMDESEVNL